MKPNKMDNTKRMEAMRTWKMKKMNSVLAIPRLHQARNMFQIT